VDGARTEGGKLSFERLDDCVPFPIPDEARPVVAFDPTILSLSQYTLKVTGLKEGNYLLKINGAPAATLTAKELGEGVNLTAFGPDPKAAQVNPVAAQGRAILAAVAAKEGLVSAWREESRKAHAPAPADVKEKLAGEYKEKLAALNAKVEAADAKIREAAKAQKLLFELSPAS
jgi:hypothetical protein